MNKFWYNVLYPKHQSITKQLDDCEFVQLLTDKIAKYKSVSVVILQDDTISDEEWVIDNVSSCEQDEKIEILDDDGKVDYIIDKATVIWNDQRRYLMFTHDTNPIITILCYN